MNNHSFLTFRHGFFLTLMVAVVTLAANCGAQTPTAPGTNTTATPLETVKSLQAGKPQYWVAYGTSLTADSAWPSELQAQANRKFPDRVRVFNAAQGGMWSGWGVGHLQERVLRLQPDAVFIEFAINDAHRNFYTSVELARLNLENMIDRIKAMYPKSDVVLLTMNPPTGVGLQLRPRIADYYQMYREVAQKRQLVLVDTEPVWSKMLKDEPEKWKKLVPDGLHPNAEGSKTVTVPLVMTSLFGAP